MDIQLERLFETAERKEELGHNSHLKVKSLQRINFLLRLRYGNARHVPENLCISLTQAIINDRSNKRLHLGEKCCFI